jgi:dCMP deaminase
MKKKLIDAHMAVAETYATLSSAKRLQVGCVIVKNDTIIGIGYNGMPSGWDNCCEDKVVSQKKEISPGVVDMSQCYELKTKPEVIHAEINAIAKVARSTNSSEDADMFITHAPCIECAKSIFQSGINRVFYRDTYRSEDGIDFLQKCDVEVIRV